MKNLTTFIFLFISIYCYSENLPSLWKQTDIGKVKIAGTSEFNQDTFAITASGRDIWGQLDEFNYVYQEFTGNFEIVCKISSVSKTDSWTKAGIMIRNTLDDNSANIMMFMRPNGKISFQNREEETNFTIVPRPVQQSKPTWLKLVRSNNTFIGYESMDGETWSVYYFTTIAMNTNVYAGLALTSHKEEEAARATFSNVHINSLDQTPEEVVKIENSINNWNLVAQSKTLFQHHLYADKKSGDTIPYRLLQPENMVENQKYPLILFLHDVSFSGEDNNKQLLPVASWFSSAETRKQFPCYVLCPQYSFKDWLTSWPEKSPTEQMKRLIKLIDIMVKKEAVDRKRVYIVGMASGGVASIEALLRYPQKFSAAMILGTYFDGFPNTKVSKRLNGIPMSFAFGERDPNIKVEYVNFAMSNLKSGGNDVNATVYPKRNYDLFVDVFSETQKLEWLLSNNKK